MYITFSEYVKIKKDLTRLNLEGITPTVLGTGTEKYVIIAGKKYGLVALSKAVAEHKKAEGRETYNSLQALRHRGDL